MSGIGFSELIILFLIGLIVLGPERLPRVANQLGSWLGQARRMTRVMKRQLEEELDLEGANKMQSPYPQSRAEQFPPKSAPAGIDPEPATSSTYTPSDDDTYSPAHDEDAAGTGVGDDDAVGKEELAESEAISDAANAGDEDGVEKTKQSKT